MILKAVIKTLFLSTVCTVAFASNPAPQSESTAAEAEPPNEQKILPQVVLETSLGNMVIELYPEEAPVSVENFLTYVDDGFYDGVIFHRVVPRFVVQGGGFDANYRRKSGNAPIVNESDNGLKNLRGTLSMARTAAPNSATSQFFISLRDNPSLDWRPNQPGYAVFGRVIEGISIIDEMAEKPQGDHSGTFANAPNEPILIESARRLSTDEPATEEGD